MKIGLLSGHRKKNGVGGRGTDMYKLGKRRFPKQDNKHGIFFPIQDSFFFYKVLFVQGKYINLQLFFHKKKT